MSSFNSRFLALSTITISFYFYPLASAKPQCDRYEKIKGGSSSQRLNKILDLAWTIAMEESPVFATYLGEKGDHGSWSDESLSAIHQRKENLACPLHALKKISRKDLLPKEQIFYDLYLESVNQELKGGHFPSEYLALSSWRGVHEFLAERIRDLPKSSLTDYQNILSRMEKAPRLIRENQILLQEGLKHKISYPKISLQKIPDQLEKLLCPEIEKSVFYEPFLSFPSEFSEESKETLRSRARHILSNSLLPALVNFQTFVLKEYLPNAVESTALSDLPRGEEWYSALIEEQTSLPISAPSVHETGLNEVKRIEQEIQILLEKAGEKDLQHFRKKLQTSSQYFLSSPDEVISRYRNLAKVIEAKLPTFFSLLPRNTYGIEPIPTYQENSVPAAYYMPGSLKSGKAGVFFANTSRLKERPIWEMESYLLHEGVPGHHLQMSLAYENDRPKILRYTDHLAFVEGWALYAENLGEEMEVYSTLESRFGKLTQELWRATRLVVDTGLHHFKWSRSKAIQYFLEHTLKTQAEAEVEIDRYLTMPAQALTYKLGQLVFLEIRSEAEATLKDAFDLREFHRALLEDGSLPLSVLRKKMKLWIEHEKKSKAFSKNTKGQVNKQD